MVFKVFGTKPSDRRNPASPGQSALQGAKRSGECNSSPSRYVFSIAPFTIALQTRPSGLQVHHNLSQHLLITFEGCQSQLGFRQFFNCGLQ